MQEYLKHYRAKLTALSPIHIGDGSQIGKKEYFYNKALKQVIIPDAGRMFADIRKLGREKSFEDFMLKDKNGDLMQWFKEQRLNPEYLTAWSKYTLDPGDAFIETSRQGKISRPRDIAVFIKDPYGMPYIPGSSLKGMIRSALITLLVKRDIGRYGNVLHKLEATALNTDNYKTRPKTFLSSETNAIETAALNTLGREEKRPSNAVNSVMSGLIVSDSKPVPASDLTLCQKVDLKINGDRIALPILREALKPGTELEFDITIDTELFPYTIDDIMEALDNFNNSCYEYFYKHFGRGSLDRGTIWLGGGTGFLSKTILYQIYGRNGLKLTDAVFKNTIGKNYSIHKHGADIRNGISPHVCKCTYYNGKLCDIGMGKLEVLN